jgi:hypothetical protein
MSPRSLARFLAPLALACLASTATAQAIGPGLTWVGASGTFAGGHFFSCTPAPVGVGAGEGVILTVWGDIQSPYGLFLAPSTGTCVMFPGFGGGLVLASPIATLAVGTLTLVTPCLSCPPGLEQHRFTVPPGLPFGVTASFQALALGGAVPSFTPAITATVQ